jgi:hypothetical protein
MILAWQNRRNCRRTVPSPVVSVAVKSPETGLVWRKPDIVLVTECAGLSISDLGISNLCAAKWIFCHTFPYSP